MQRVNTGAIAIAPGPRLGNQARPPPSLCAHPHNPRPPYARPPQRATAAPRTPGRHTRQVLTATDLRLDLGGKRLFSNLSFDLPAGSIRGVIGPNGSGKTSLLNVIAGRVQPDAGGGRPRPTRPTPPHLAGGSHETSS